MAIVWGRRHSVLSLNDPLLTDEDSLSETYRQSGDLDDLVARFGRSLLNVSPKDISRLKTAVANDDTEEISEIIGTPESNTNVTNNIIEFSQINMTQDSLFKTAVKECKTEWVEFFFQKIADQSIPFDIAASMTTESFNNLWLDYKFLLEAMIEKDIFGWDICRIEVPLETFTVASNFGSRVGTCNTHTEWIAASQAGVGLEHWRSLNPKGVNNVLKKCRGRKVTAIIKIFCIENACQVGVDGIVRLLLMHKAPSSLFKTPLIKCTILFKWERIWKVLAFKHLAAFLVCFVGFHVLVAVSLIDEFAFSCVLRTVLTKSALLLLALLVILTLRHEYFQLGRCVNDARNILPWESFRGIRNYFSSRQNQIDLMLSGTLIVFFIILALNSEGKIDNVSGSVYRAGLAFDLLLMWGKAFYLAQAFKKSGIFLVMIRRVLQECAPYFLMLFGITVGFGLAMRVAFVQYSREHEYSYKDQLSELESKNLSSINETFWILKTAFQHETEERSIENFGTLYKSILSMAYAMVGLFDPEVLFHCGSLKGLMIALFVVYLLLQTIVMFNMLIASMGDAFDGVRAEEEELFLMARATFIDQYEASLSNKAIQKTKSETGKYLYVLIPEDKQLEEDVSFWKGRIPTIKEDVTKILTDSQSQQSQNMNEMLKTLREDINNDMKRQEERISGILEERIAKILEERMMLLEQRINAQSVSL